MHIYARIRQQTTHMHQCLLSNKMVFVCLVRRDSFESVLAHDSHMWSVHLPQTAKIAEKCVGCGLRFRTAIELYRHMRINGCRL